MRTLFIAVRALTFMTGFVILWGWIALSVRSFDADFGLSFPARTVAVGIILMMIGGTLVLICAGLFITQGRGTPAIFDAPREFVAVGPYQYIRNPMYLGALTVLVGLGLYQRSISILLLSLVWLLVVHRFVVYYEEPNLKRKFGMTYEEYRMAVPRWIPRGRGDRDSAAGSTSPPGLHSGADK